MILRCIVILTLVCPIMPGMVVRAAELMSYVDELIMASDDNPGRKMPADVLEKLAGVMVLIDTDNPATQRIREILEAIPEKERSVRIASSIAIDLVRQGKYSDASKTYFNLILRFPRDPNISRFQIAMARTYIMMRDFDQAKANLEPLARSQSIDSGWAMLELAKIALLNRKPEDATRRYKSIEVTFPGSFAAKLATREIVHIQLRDQIKKPGA